MKKHKLSYILGAKPDDHKFLYQLVDEAVVTGEAVEFFPSKPMCITAFAM